MGFREIFYGPAFRELREQWRTGRLSETCRACTGALQEDLNDPRVFSARDALPREAQP